jgi:hypothetical protein
MKYRTAMCVCAALLCASSAWAQDEEEDAPPPKPVGASTVTLYGLIDQGVEFVNNVANGKNKTTNGWRTGDGTATSYFGIRGSEDLGDGVKAIFDLQGGFSPTTGASRQGGLVNESAISSRSPESAPLEVGGPVPSWSWSVRGRDDIPSS